MIKPHKKLVYPVIDKTQQYRDGNYHFTKGGINLREEFAKAAMQGLLSTNHVGWPDPELIAREAIKHADELLKQLEATKQ